MPNRFKIENVDLEVAVALFQDPEGNDRHFYVAGVLDREEFSKRFDSDLSHDYVQCKPLGFDDYGTKYWLAGVVIGNAGGPMAIIRADNMEKAIDFLTEDFKCCQLDEKEIAEMEAEGRGDEVHYNDGGTAYTSDNMHCREIKLVRIDVD